MLKNAKLQDFAHLIEQNLAISQRVTFRITSTDTVSKIKYTHYSNYNFLFLWLHLSPGRFHGIFKFDIVEPITSTLSKLQEESPTATIN